MIILFLSDNYKSIFVQLQRTNYDFWYWPHNTPFQVCRSPFAAIWLPAGGPSHHWSEMSSTASNPMTASSPVALVSSSGPFAQDWWCPAAGGWPNSSAPAPLSLSRGVLGSPARSAVAVSWGYLRFPPILEGTCGCRLGVPKGLA